MEDLFSVRHASPGLDVQGHLGYAAQPGLAPFGRDVFNNPGGPRGHHGGGSHRLWAVPASALGAVLVVPALGRQRRRLGANSKRGRHCRGAGAGSPGSSTSSAICISPR